MAETDELERRIKHAQDLIEIISKMPVALILTTQGGFIERINPRTETLFGYRAEEIVGRHLACFFLGWSEKSANDTTNLMANLKQHCLESPCDTKMQKRDGTEISVEIISSELVTSDGDRVLFCVLGTSNRQVFGI